MKTLNKISNVGLILSLLSFFVMIVLISLGFTSELSLDMQNLAILYVFIGWLIPSAVFFGIKELTEEFLPQ